MSSTTVVTEIMNFLNAAAPTENILELDGHYEEIQDFIADNGLTMNDPWVGVQFVGSDEIPIALTATNATGKYRETGVIYVHVVDIAKLGVQTSIRTRADALRNSLRGRRINSIVINSVTPANFGAGATLQFEGGFTSASFLVSYEMDINL